MNDQVPDRWLGLTAEASDTAGSAAATATTARIAVAAISNGTTDDADPTEGVGGDTGLEPVTSRM